MSQQLTQKRVRKTQRSLFIAKALEEVATYRIFGENLKPTENQQMV